MRAEQRMYGESAAIRVYYPEKCIYYLVEIKRAE
jgi:hypothetical protein